MTMEYAIMLNRESGSHWFDPGTMEFFGERGRVRPAP